MDKIKEKIGLAIGQASMCWSETPKGVFESSRAEQIVADLYLFFLQELEKRQNKVNLQDWRDLKDILNPPAPREPFIKTTFKCSKCGIDFNGAMGYVCQDPQCPTQPRITCGT